MLVLDAMSARYTCPKVVRFTENRSVVQSEELMINVLVRKLFVVAFEDILFSAIRFATVSEDYQLQLCRWNVQPLQTVNR